MQGNNGLEKIGNLFIAKKPKKMSAYIWQDLALMVIKELNIPAFKRSAVFKVCKENPRVYVEKCLNDTKELCHGGERWKYFFKVAARGGKTKIYSSKFMVKYPTPKGDS